MAFITKGTVGRVGMGRPGQPESVFAPQVCYWRSLDPNQLEPRFLFCLLTSAEFQASLDAVKTHGSMAVDYVSMTDQRDFRLTFPPIREQKAIASVLAALGDKIELNRRMNATLEAMARTLFQSWFVDFDSVRLRISYGGQLRATRNNSAGLPAEALAKAGLDPATAALFPDSFQDSQLGHIPKGWTVGRVANVSNFSRSAINPGEFPDEIFDHYSLPAFDEGRTPKAELGSAIMSNKSSASPREPFPALRLARNRRLNP